MPFNRKAVKKLYRIKGRSDKKPIALLVSSRKLVKKFAKNVPAKAKRLMNKYWPGPLTLILSKRSCVPGLLTAGLTTIGIRMPKNNIALKLIKKAGGALAVTSANLSGGKPATSAGQLRKLKGVDLVIDGGKCRIGIPSSVVLVKDKELVVLRKGPVQKLKY